MSPQHILLLSAVLFTMGVFGVLWNRGAITILMCVEIMLNAGNLAFISFARQFDQRDGRHLAGLDAAGQVEVVPPDVTRCDCLTNTPSRQAFSDHSKFRISPGPESHKTGLLPLSR